MADSLADITDEDLQERLARFGHTIVKGKLTDAQRQIQKKKLNHLEAKERAEREKAEKEAAKREKEEKESAKRALGSPPPRKKAKTTSRRKTVAISSITPENDDEAFGEPAFAESSSQHIALKSTLASKDKAAAIDAAVSERSPLVIHLVDANSGCAAVAVPVTLSVLHATRGWFQLAERQTNIDGECPGLITKDLFQGGLYRVWINTEEYYKSINSKVHFPHVEISINVQEPGEKYRVSVMLMPYGYTSTILRSN